MMIFQLYSNRPKILTLIQFKSNKGSDRWAITLSNYSPDMVGVHSFVRTNSYGTIILYDVKL